MVELTILSFILFLRQKLRRANVSFLSPPVSDGTTGTVIVLTTPDAQRTMLAYQVILLKTSSVQVFHIDFYKIL